MLIRVNGKEREIPENTTLESLLKSLELKPQGIALEVNREIVPKRLYDETILHPGDAVEIVRMTGGG
ncbi:MAG: sulfur carrier protein ThiS [Deltaproteobacteria bacterium]|nr:sulfur carrier protein ThiS [Deltaproteobacteria bacterium]